MSLCRSGALLTKLEVAGDMYHGTQLKTGGPSFQPARVELTDNLITALDKRFSDGEEGVILATALLNLQTWPDQNDSAGEEIFFFK